MDVVLNCSGYVSFRSICFSFLHWFILSPYVVTCDCLLFITLATMSTIHFYLYVMEETGLCTSIIFIAYALRLLLHCTVFGITDSEVIFTGVVFASVIASIQSVGLCKIDHHWLSGDWFERKTMWLLIPGACFSCHFAHKSVTVTGPKSVDRMCSGFAHQNSTPQCILGFVKPNYYLLHRKPVVGLLCGVIHVRGNQCFF